MVCYSFIYYTFPLLLIICSCERLIVNFLLIMNFKYACNTKGKISVCNMYSLTLFWLKQNNLIYVHIYRFLWNEWIWNTSTLIILAMWLGIRIKMALLTFFHLQNKQLKLKFLSRQTTEGDWKLDTSNLVFGQSLILPKLLDKNSVPVVWVSSGLGMDFCN
jgi:hypothetical protein